jgi:hypothetical protein
LTRKLTCNGVPRGVSEFRDQVRRYHPETTLGAIKDLWVKYVGIYTSPTHDITTGSPLRRG